MTITSPADRDVLAGGLSSELYVVYTPLRDIVARLDTSHARCVLYLDSDSPAEDHRWALLDVLHLLGAGPHAAVDGRPPRLRLVGRA